MNKNKGIIGIGLILAIVLGIVVVGGGAWTYYLGKKLHNENTEFCGNNGEFCPGTPGYEEMMKRENQNQNNNVGGASDVETLIWPNQIASSNCTNIDGVTAPILLSPNGGESFTSSQKITVNWKSCVPESLSMGSVGLFIYMQSQVPSSGSTFGLGYELVHITSDDGSAEVVLPTKDQWKDMEYGKNFKIQIWHPQYQSVANPMDYSDGLFTINSPTKNISTTLPQYVGTHSDCGEQSKCWPPVIATFSESYSCNIGVAPNTEGNYVTAQRVINGRTYCINSLSDGYAGGRGYTYAYTTSNGNGTKIATFGLTSSSCGGYGGPGGVEYDQCKKNTSSFFNNLDVMIDSLMFN